MFLSDPFVIIEQIGFLLFFLEIILMQLIFMRKFRRRSVFWARLFVCLSVGCAFMFLPSVFLWIFNISYLFVCLYCVLVTYFCFEAKFGNCVFYVFSAWATQHISWSIFMIFCQLVALSRTATVITELAVLFVTYIIVFFVFSFRRADYEIKSERISATVLSGVVLLLTVFIYDIVDEYDVRTVGYSAYAIISCFLVLFVQYGISRNEIVIRQKTELTSENDLLEDMLRTQGKQQKLAEETVEIINRKCHDLKHQVTALRMMDKEEGDRYLDEIENAVMIYGDIAKTGNEALDVVLTERSLLCDGYKIKFSYLMDGKLLNFMSSVDISALFGNMLDNALESCLQIEEEKRMISLSTSQQNGLIRIHCENCYGGKIQFVDGMPVSAQAESGNHGFGTKSMKYIVEKYGGKIKFLTDDELFVVNIAFPFSK